MQNASLKKHPNSNIDPFGKKNYDLVVFAIRSAFGIKLFWNSEGLSTPNTETFIGFSHSQKISG